MSKTCRKFDFGMEQKKQQHFIIHSSISLLCIRFVAVAFRAEEEEVFFWKTGTPVTYFCPTLDPPLCRSGQNTSTYVCGQQQH